MLTVGSVVVNTLHVRRAAAFWMQTLDCVPRDGALEGDFVVLVPRSRVGAGPSLNLSESPAPEYPDVHLDLYAANRAEQEPEVARLLSLGARRVDWDRYPAGHHDFVVLADTEGNRFCVIDKARE